MNTKKVLIVDDDPTVRELLRESLAYEGYVTVAVENGSQAYDQFRLNVFDIVILDMNMPKMDGAETVKALRERHHNVPILIISGMNDPEWINEALRNGANDFLQKPFTTEALILKCAKFG